MTSNISTLEKFIGLLSETPEADLVFTAEGEAINKDYHVTEIKLAHVRGLDCGSQADEWDEALVQLLDGPANPGAEATYMTASTFLKIAGAGNKAIDAVGSSELYFEFSSSNKALRKLSVHDVAVEDGTVRVDLGAVSAVCKPAFRGQTEGLSGGCCGPAPEAATPDAGGACCAPAPEAATPDAGGACCAPAPAGEACCA